MYTCRYYAYCLFHDVQDLEQKLEELCFTVLPDLRPLGADDLTARRTVAVDDPMAGGP